METTGLIHEIHNDDIADEVQALSAILCADQEFQVQSINEKEIVLVIHPHQIKNHLITLTVILDMKSYPVSSPQLSVQSPRLSRAALDIIDTLIKEEAYKLRGQVTILSLIEWLVRYCNLYEEKTIPATESLTGEAEYEYTTIAHLHHIRSKTIYVKTLSQWFRELDLHGVLISYRRWIFLMISGNKNNLQVLYVAKTSLIDQLIRYPWSQLYLKRHRTQNVDIDSVGRPCKERMLTVLGQVEGRLDAASVLDEVVLDDSSEDWLKYWSSRPSLASIYQKFIQPQTGQKK
ncbi:RWD domain-containing protein 3-like isoform X1 [Daphnia carinata]|uniref:RWD domain-containing protein 3-like isoform X1 n=1 Tax=Daphnia carinata TaxID=120202 RepID=UPI00257F3288|nr:RWD domain-containing protein 3-like isoform X1 [Daphnia carinata]XP_059352838.1 RWD domain-containing protein 3-like isoform X1 [Daphnia carinata]